MYTLRRLLHGSINKTHLAFLFKRVELLFGAVWLPISYNTITLFMDQRQLYGEISAYYVPIL